MISLSDSCDRKSRSWFTQLHKENAYAFELFKDVYDAMHHFEFGIVDRGRLDVFDAAHLFLVSSLVKPQVVIETGSANGFMTSLMAVSSPRSILYAFEEHPGPRIASQKRAEHFGYSDRLVMRTFGKHWIDNRKLLESADSVLFCVSDRVQFRKVWAKYKAKLRKLRKVTNLVFFYPGHHMRMSNCECSHVREYTIPNPILDRRLIVGEWHDLLSYWDYMKFGDKIFNIPSSSALFLR